MTFIVNQDGVVFQKDLGEDTATRRRRRSRLRPGQLVDRGRTARRSLRPERHAASALLIRHAAGRSTAVDCAGRDRFGSP